jgi:exosortase
MIMGIIFILFTLKDRSPDRKWDWRRSAVPALVAFALYVILLVYASGTLSFEFLSYRIDALLLPLLLLSIVIGVFGIYGTRRYAPVLAYLLFASPLLLGPLFGLSNPLASFSADIVYGILKLGGAHVLISSLSILAPSGLAIEIAQACVPLGTFVAFVFLMLPLAYLYTGAPSKKAAWLVSAVLLFFALNILRMVIVSVAWIYYGIGGAVGAFHLFGGYIIFCAAAIIMLFLDRKFGLCLDFGSKWHKKTGSALGSVDLSADWPRIALPLAFALIALYLSAGYSGANSVSQSMFANNPISNSSYPVLYRSLVSSASASGVAINYLGSTSNGLVFQLGNSTNPNATTFMIVTFYPYEEPGGNVFQYNSSGPTESYILKNGIVISELNATSDNRNFSLDYFALPYKLGSGLITANFELFSKRSAQISCNPGIGGPAEIRTALFNLLRGHAAPDKVMCYAYSVASSRFS